MEVQRCSVRRLRTDEGWVRDLGHMGTAFRVCIRLLYDLSLPRVYTALGLDSYSRSTILHVGSSASAKF